MLSLLLQHVCDSIQPASQPASKQSKQAKQAKHFGLQKIDQYYYIEKPNHTRPFYSMFCGCSKASSPFPLCKKLSSKLSKLCVFFRASRQMSTHTDTHTLLPSISSSSLCHAKYHPSSTLWTPSTVQSIIHHPLCGLLVLYKVSSIIHFVDS